MTTLSRRALLAGATLAVLTAGAGGAQVVTREAATPVQVLKGTGDFAKKLHGAVMPTGSGWRAVSDREKRVQLMVPERWKVQDVPEGDTILRLIPPDQGKEPKAVLMVVFHTPRDADPLDIDEDVALGYAEGLADDPALKRLDFKPTDSGYILARGLHFALAGGTMVYKKKETFQQEQLLFVGEDRVVSVQFAAEASQFPKYADELIKIFASYQNLGVRKIE